jgi:putative FmdB family regulatory protein
MLRIQEDAMPLYEYRCKSCNEKEEKLEGIDAPKAHDCPKCGAPGAMLREVSLTSFTLSGGGWMAQGYGKGGKKGKKDAAPAKTEGTAAPAKAEGPAPAAGGCAGGCACHAAKKP